jgi:hypothetical protein
LKSLHDFFIADSLKYIILNLCDQTIIHPLISHSVT